MIVGFVFTNYNNSYYTRNLIESIFSFPEPDNSIIVIVDNNSGEEDINSLNTIIRDYPSVKLILNPSNVGYFRGLNVGIEFLRISHPECNHVIIGNNDLIFPSDFQIKLKSIQPLFAKYPVISPDLLTLDGVHQNPHVVREISKAREVIYDIYYSNYYLSLVIGTLAKWTRKFTDRDDEQQFRIGQIIYQGYGACYILGPLFFENFSALWAPTFLMSEEFFLSKQLTDKGLNIYYEPSILVHHHDHATMDKLPGRKLWSISRDSHLIYREYVKI